MICRWCREPLETIQVQYEGLTIVQDCIRPACVAARRQELGARQYAHALSKQRPPGRVVRCLPGLCEPFPFTPPGAQPLCRHCETILEREETPHEK